MDKELYEAVRAYVIMLMNTKNNSPEMASSIARLLQLL